MSVKEILGLLLGGAGRKGEEPNLGSARGGISGSHVDVREGPNSNEDAFSEGV
jgi:hypothetical protein